MKLNEISDDFENTKSNSSQDKLDLAERRISGLMHEIETIDQIINRNYKGRYKGLFYLDNTDEEKAKSSQTSFKTKDERDHDRYAFFSGLLPTDIQPLTRLFAKLTALYTAHNKIEKGLSAIKLKIKKENGTYVSQADTNMYERDLQNDIGKLLMDDLGSGYSYTLSSTRTKKNGTSTVHLRLFNANKKAEGDVDKKFRVQLKEVIKQWLDANGFTLHRVAFSSSPHVGEVGWLDVKVKTAELVKRYKNKP